MRRNTRGNMLAKHASGQPFLSLRDAVMLVQFPLMPSNSPLKLHAANLSLAGRRYCVAEIRPCDMAYLCLCCSPRQNDMTQAHKNRELKQSLPSCLSPKCSGHCSLCQIASPIVVLSASALTLSHENPSNRDHKQTRLLDETSDRHKASLPTHDQ